MTIVPFIPKDDQQMPDFYTLSINTLTGKTLTYEVVSHRFISDYKLLEIQKKNDTLTLIPVASLVSIDFDLAFTKVLELDAARKREAMAAPSK